MSSVAFEVPGEALIALELGSLGGKGAQARCCGEKLFELLRISSGGAAAPAGIPRVAFLAKLGVLGAPALRQSEVELLEDLGCA